MILSLEMLSGIERVKDGAVVLACSTSDAVRVCHRSEI